MDFTGGSEIEEALTRVGELLAADGERYAIVILGGAALNLLGIVERTTTDVDIVAIAASGGAAAPRRGTLRAPPEQLPESLIRAAGIVARDYDLDPEWLNTGPALQWHAGLPPGLEERLEWRHYGTLWVGIVARVDLIFFKLYAAADSSGTGSVHYQDLIALRPTAPELGAAAAWVAKQDASPEFAAVLDQVVTLVRADARLS